MHRIRNLRRTRTRVEGSGRRTHGTPPSDRLDRAEYRGGSAWTGQEILQSAPGDGVTRGVEKRLLQNDRRDDGAVESNFLPPVSS
jgi:hypothetical protein